MAAIAEAPIRRTIRRNQLREMVRLADSTIPRRSPGFITGTAINVDGGASPVV
jgi:hypothetical protein